jgi:hypothetical protein
MHLMNLRAALSRELRSRKCALRRPRVRLCLEVLDQRINPFGDNVWIAPEGGAWSDPDNWSLGRVPATGDVLHFGAGQFGYGTDTDAFCDMIVSVHEVDTAGYSQTITIAGSLTVEEDFIQRGTLWIPGGSLDVGNDLVINGTMLTGDATIEAGVIVVECWGSWYCDHTTVTNVTANQLYQGGTLRLLAGLPDFPTVLNLNGAYRQLPCGTLVLESNTEYNIVSITPAIFNGTVIFLGGRLTSTGGIVLSDGGEFDVTGGSVGGDVINDSGTIRIRYDMNYFPISGNYTQYVLGTLDMDYSSSVLGVGGTANLNGTLRIRGVFELGGVTDEPEIKLIFASTALGDFAVKDVGFYPPPGWEWVTFGGWDFSGSYPVYVFDIEPAP